MRQPYEIDPVCAPHGREPVAAQYGDAWWWSGLGRVIGSERAELVVLDSFSHSSFTRDPLRHDHAFTAAQRSQEFVVQAGPPSWHAFRTAAVSTEWAKQVWRTIGLGAVLRQALQMHRVAAAGGEGDTELGTLSSRREALKANATMLLATARWWGGGCHVASRGGSHGSGGGADRQRRMSSALAGVRRVRTRCAARHVCKRGEPRRIRRRCGNLRTPHRMPKSCQAEDRFLEKLMRGANCVQE